MDRQQLNEREFTVARTREASASAQCMELLLDHIFTYLPLQFLIRCQRVSTTWRKTLQESPSLWTSTSLPRELRPKLTTEALQQMARCSKGQLREIDLRGANRVSCGALWHGGCSNYTKGVETLRLNREEQAKTLPPAIDMCGGMQSLRVLDLRWCPGVDDALILALARSPAAGSLEELNLRGCLISDEGVIWAVRSCVELVSLDIGAWPYSRLRGVRSVTDICLFFIAQCAALRGSAFSLRSLGLAGRRGVTDEGLDAVLEFVPALARLDVRNCPHIAQGATRTSGGEYPEDLVPAGSGGAVGGGEAWFHADKVWRLGGGGQRVELVCDGAVAARRVAGGVVGGDGALTPEDYGEEYGLADEWGPLGTAAGLWQVVQLLQSIASVRAAAELQARATAEAQAADMLVEAREVQTRAMEIHSQAIDMQAQAADILARVSEVQAQVSAMQRQAEEQGHIAARAQAAEMQAQVAQMQVHAAQMQVHAAQMQIRATEMQGQAAEMQASALSIRAQAAALSLADGEAALAAAGLGAAAAAAAAAEPEDDVLPPASGAAEEAARVAVAAVEREEASGAAAGLGVGGGEGAAAAGEADMSMISTTGIRAAGAEDDGEAAGDGGGGAGLLPLLLSRSRFQAVREETARLTQTVRELTAQVERVTAREQMHAAALTREVEHVTRRAEAFLQHQRALGRPEGVEEHAPTAAAAAATAAAAAGWVGLAEAADEGRAAPAGESEAAGDVARRGGGLWRGGEAGSGGDSVAAEEEAEHPGTGWAGGDYAVGRTGAPVQEGGWGNGWEEVGAEGVSAAAASAAAAAAAEEEDARRGEAELRSVAAVEARLRAVRAEQERLTQTVLSLRARIESLQLRDP